MLSYDVAGQFGKNGMKEDKLLGRAKWFIFIGGTLALILSLNPPEDILFFGADIWGSFCSDFYAFNLRGRCYIREEQRPGPTVHLSWA